MTERREMMSETAIGYAVHLTRTRGLLPDELERSTATLLLPFPPSNGLSVVLPDRRPVTLRGVEYDMTTGRFRAFIDNEKDRGPGGLDWSEWRKVFP